MSREFSKKLKFLVVLLIFLTSPIVSDKTKKKSTTSKPTFYQLFHKYFTHLEINNAYFSYSQYLNFISDLKTDYSDYVQVLKIGESYEGNDMFAIRFIMPKAYTMEKYSISSSQYEIMKNTLQNPGILFTGLLNGGEPVSLMMNVYMILYLLALPNHFLQTITGSTNSEFIPMVDVEAD